MKKHLIIGNPITHSLSPKIHNFWLKTNGIEGDKECVIGLPMIKCFFI